MTFGIPRSSLAKSSVLPSGSAGKTSAAAPARRPERSALAERGDVDDAAPAEVQQVGPGLHRDELALADEAAREGRLRDVQGDEVGLRQQVRQGRRGPVVAHRQLRRDVVEEHLHAERLGEDADLGADVAVADDAERLAADLVAGGRLLAPAALVHLARAVREAAGERDDLGDHQLGDAAGVAERRVEDAHPALTGGVEGHLVRADAEGAEREQPAGLGQDAGRDPGLAADAEDVHVADLLDELVLGEGSRGRLEAEALLPEDLLGARVDVLEQEDADLALGKRGLGRGGGGRGGHGRRSRVGSRAARRE